MELSEKKRKALEDLKSQNWYKFYIRNWGVGGNSIRGRSSMRFFREEPVRYWTAYTMEWMATSQGHRYWSKIHDEWWSKYKYYGE